MESKEEVLERYITGIDPHPTNVFLKVFDREKRLKEVWKTRILPDEIEYNNLLTEFSASFTTTNTRIISEDVNGPGKGIVRTFQKAGYKVAHVDAKRTAAFKKANKNKKSDDWDCFYIVQAYLANPHIGQLKLNFKENYYLDLRDVSMLRYLCGHRTNNLKRKLSFRLASAFGKDWQKQFKKKKWYLPMIREGLAFFSKYKDPQSVVSKWYFIFLLVYELAKRETEEVLKDIKNEEVDRLCEIDGIGLVSASQLVSIIKLGKEPKSEAHLSSWAGTAPIILESSEKGRHFADTQRHPKLNHIFHVVSKIGKIVNEKTKIYWNKLISRGLHPKKAMRIIKRLYCRLVFKKLYPEKNKV